jgi:UDP-N-acetylglucosamine 2-epimerase (non-hydrolysing)
MLQQVLDVFGVEPEEDLCVMQDRQTLFDITGKVLLGMKEVLEREKPDILLVHGDTTTTFASGLAAFYLGIPVGHVEAGLRTYNIDSPWPEEFNRQAVDSFSRFYFAPTQASRQNLLREGKSESAIFVTGNTEIDAVRLTVRESFTHPLMDWAQDSRLIMMTAHRRENLGAPMQRIFRAVRRVVDKHEDIKLIYPVHLNPVVRETAQAELGNHPRIRLIEPLDVLTFNNFVARSHLVLTDSGGIQEAAPALGKPVLVLRDTTERPEGIEAGTLRLAGTDEETVAYEFTRLLTDKDAYDAMSQAKNPYGDGYAARRIADVLEKEL